MVNQRRKYRITASGRKVLCKKNYKSPNSNGYLNHIKHEPTTEVFNNMKQLNIDERYPEIYNYLKSLDGIKVYKPFIHNCYNILISFSNKMMAYERLSKYIQYFMINNNMYVPNNEIVYKISDHICSTMILLKNPSEPYIKLNLQSSRKLDKFKPVNDTFETIC